MGKNTNLYKLEQSLVKALVEINILHTGIPFGNYTEEGLEIFNANRVLLGYAKLPSFDRESLYKQKEVSEKMKIFLNQVFDIFYQRKTWKILKRYFFRNGSFFARGFALSHNRRKR